MDGPRTSRDEVGDGVAPGRLAVVVGGWLLAAVAVVVCVGLPLVELTVGIEWLPRWLVYALLGAGIVLLWHSASRRDRNHSTLEKRD